VLWLFVAVRVLVNPLSNVFQKLLTRQGAPPAAIVGWTHGLLAMIAIPLVVIEPPPATSAFWIGTAVSAILAVASNVRLVRAVDVQSDGCLLGGFRLTLSAEGAGDSECSPPFSLDAADPGMELVVGCAGISCGDSIRSILTTFHTGGARCGLFLCHRSFFGLTPCSGRATISVNSILRTLLPPLRSAAATPLKPALEHRS
jgi:hypothetical protein